MLYAVWKPDVIIKFNSGIANNDNSIMPARVVQLGQDVNIGDCLYPGPADERRLFTYYPSPTVSLKEGDEPSGIWETVQNNENRVNAYRFINWKYTFNSQTGEISATDKLRIGEIGWNDIPVVVMTAQWELMYYVVKFKVLGYDYCDVLVDVDTNVLNYPVKPTIVYPRKKFLCWDTMDETLSGVDSTANIVCGTASNPVLCDDGPIVCDGDEIQTLVKSVNACIGENALQAFDVVFKMLVLDGSQVVVQQRVQNVSENTYLPSFHIHQDIEITQNGQKFKYVFRYWKLANGIMSSSMTVMSNLEFIGIYDKVKNDD